MSVPKVRFAPSPTGELHIGGARTALFNYLYVKKYGGRLVLRIDDTDLERSRSSYIDKLIEALRWLGLNWDEGPYYQSRRLELYRKEAEQLIDAGKAYRCFCTTRMLEEGRSTARSENKTYLYPGTCRNLSLEEQRDLQEKGNSFVVRLLTPDEGVTVVRDEIRGEVEFENAGIDDFIILKSNGLPTYNYASIVDDLDLGITDVIRAEEHLSNTPRQQLCAAALGRELPRFAHVPMILAADRSKLSKRHGATSVEEFQAEGHLPEALVNYMALLGWSPGGGGEEEIFTLEELAGRFELNRVNKTAAIYDVNKLAWMNGHYLRDYDPDRLVEAAMPFFEDRGLIKRPLDHKEYSYMKDVIVAVRERARTLVELADASLYFFTDFTGYDEKGEKKHFQKKDAVSILYRLADELSRLEPFNQEEAEALYSKLADSMELSTGRLIQPTRLALTGRTAGPGLFEIISLLGRETTVKRLKNAAAYIEKSLA